MLVLYSKTIKKEMKPNILLLLIVLTLTTILSNHYLAAASKIPTNETVYKISKQLCWNCMKESIQFLFGHNLVRARKLEIPLIWDSQLAQYASWWAGQRRGDCQLVHSFPEDNFQLGENIYWGSGNAWTAMDAVNTWADEEKYYSYKGNSCVEGQMCGHYTQIVWKSTRKVGCARVVCDNGDVFMTCNYYPPGNVIGERPY